MCTFHGHVPTLSLPSENIAGNLENVGYCKSGFESIYNIQMMEEKQTIIAFGAGAVTKVIYPDENRIERAFNVKSLEEYIKRVDEMVERKRKYLTLLKFISVSVLTANIPPVPLICPDEYGLPSKVIFTFAFENMCQRCCTL